MIHDSLADVRAVADAVLYEGYLLYPYRASSSKNQSRWQFGVLGPPQASAASFGEEPAMSMQCLLRSQEGAGEVCVHLRFLQLQDREVQRRDADGRHTRVDELTVDGHRLLSWEEAVEREVVAPAHGLDQPVDTPVRVPGGEDAQELRDASGAVVGRVLRRRWPLAASIATRATVDDGFVRLSVSVRNEHPDVAVDKDGALRVSLIGAHVLVQAHQAEFVSLLDPPDEAAGAATRCQQQRCWPVLGGAAGSTDVVLGAPIILYDHPEVAEQSAGALFDSTEIDEILTLRVMTMTEDEKAEARATDSRAAEIIDRCDAMSDSDLQRLHGVMRDPDGATDPASGGGPPLDLRGVEPPSFDTGTVPWWDPEADAAVRPATDAVMVDGVRIARDSLVRVHPSRRADAQDLFFADQVARVTAVVSDVDGQVHVALVLVDDPAAELHDWYGRYLYFAPDELEPLPVGTQPGDREESRT